MTHETPAIWEQYVPEDELRLFALRGFGESIEPGDRPLLLVIDVVRSFLGPRIGEPGPVPPTACGEMGWERLPNIVRLVEEARTHGVPVVFTRGNVDDRIHCGGSTKLEARRDVMIQIHDTTLPDELVPTEDEWVLRKTKASVFFGTPLVSYLIGLNIDTLVICGVSTSGCVRASAVDAASLNFRVFVVEEACFDRSRFAHAANLFDIQQKYGDVVTLQAGLELLSRASARVGGR